MICGHCSLPSICLLYLLIELSLFGISTVSASLWHQPCYGIYAIASPLHVPTGSCLVRNVWIVWEHSYFSFMDVWKACQGLFWLSHSWISLKFLASLKFIAYPSQDHSVILTELLSHLSAIEICYWRHCWTWVISILHFKRNQPPVASKLLVSTAFHTLKEWQCWPGQGGGLQHPLARMLQTCTVLAQSL